MPQDGTSPRRGASFASSARTTASRSTRSSRPPSRRSPLSRRSGTARSTRRAAAAARRSKGSQRGIRSGQVRGQPRGLPRRPALPLAGWPGVGLGQTPAVPRPAAVEEWPRQRGLLLVPEHRGGPRQGAAEDHPRYRPRERAGVPRQVDGAVTSGLPHAGDHSGRILEGRQEGARRGRPSAWQALGPHPRRSPGWPPRPPPPAWPGSL